MGIIGSYKARGSWPIRRNRWKQFCEKNSLGRVRLYNTNGVEHTIVPIQNNTKENKSKCALCGSDKAKRNTMSMCSIFQVPLCTQTFKNDSRDTVTCFRKWHTSTDLKRCGERCQERLVEYYKANTEDRKGNTCNLPAVPSSVGMEKITPPTSIVTRGTERQINEDKSFEEEEITRPKTMETRGIKRQLLLSFGTNKKKTKKEKVLIE